MQVKNMKHAASRVNQVPKMEFENRQEGARNRPVFVLPSAGWLGLMFSIQYGVSTFL
jgi:hypothetical protein